MTAHSPLNERDDLVVFVTLMIGCLMAQSVSSLIGRPHLGPIFAMMVGALVGAVIHFGLHSSASHSAVFEFDDDIFTYVLVPPIVFNDAFNLPKRRFFRGFGMSCMFGVVGTLLQTLSVGFILWAFADAGIIHALESATVTEALIFAVAISPSAGSSLIEAAEFPALHGIAVGESVINDPMCIILFTALRKWTTPGTAIDGEHTVKIVIEFFTLIGGSTAIGLVGGLAGSFLLTRISGRVEGLESVQFALLFLVPYLSYVVAERVDWSGITALFSCGVLLANYGYTVCSSVVQVSSVYFFEMIAFLCETFMYTYIGINIWLLQQDLGHAEHSPHKFVLVAVGAVFVSRMVHTGLLSSICGLCCVNSPSWRETIAMGYAGVLRDTVTIALTSSIRHRTHGGALVAVAFYVLLSTSLIIPVTFPYVCRLLSVADEEEEEHSSKIHIQMKRNSGELVHSAPPYAVLAQQIPPDVEQYTLHQKWRRFDDRVLRCLFGGIRSDDIMNSVAASPGHAHADPVSWQDDIPDPLVLASPLQVAGHIESLVNKPDRDSGSPMAGSASSRPSSSLLGTGSASSRPSNPLKYGF